MEEEEEEEKDDETEEEEEEEEEFDREEAIENYKVKANNQRTPSTHNSLFRNY